MFVQLIHFPAVKRVFGGLLCVSFYLVFRLCEEWDRKHMRGLPYSERRNRAIYPYHDTAEQLTEKKKKNELVTALFALV